MCAGTLLTLTSIVVGLPFEPAPCGPVPWWHSVTLFMPVGGGVGVGAAVGDALGVGGGGVGVAVGDGVGLGVTPACAANDSAIEAPTATSITLSFPTFAITCSLQSTSLYNPRVGVATYMCEYYASLVPSRL
jgi:hypothetical protein